MAFAWSTRLALIASLLSTGVVTQNPTFINTGNCQQPGGPPLTACASYSATLSSSCASFVIATDEVGYLSCFCGQALYNLETSCLSEIASCTGSELSPEQYTSDVSSILSYQSQICGYGLGGPGVITGTPSSSSSTPSSSSSSLPASTSAETSSESSSSTSSSRGSTITSTSASQPQTLSTVASVSSTGSAQSSAFETRPISNVLYLSAGLIAAAMLL